jgi:NADH-quinone oxidoreductase subunit N
MGDFNLTLILPVVALAAFGLLSLLFAPALKGQSRVLGGISLLGIAVAAAGAGRLWTLWRAAGPLETAGGMVRVDGFGLFFSFVLLVVGALTIVGSLRFLEREEADHAEFYPLVLFALAGMVAMVLTTHLIMVLIGLEVFSLSLYVLTGLTRGRVRSVESSLKYFLLGAFSSGFLVYGMALLYGAAGSLDMRRIGSVAATSPSPMLWMGMGLVLIGLAFKIGVVPFHHWVPDVYEGAPTNVAGFMATATKTAAFAVLLRFLAGAFAGSQAAWVPLVTVLAILTMTVANLVALAQTNIKRLLAFSSVAHAGYLLIAVVCRPEDGVKAILFYLASYAFMTLGAFTVAAAVGRGDAHSEPGYDLGSWAGLGWRRKGLGVAMSLFLFSLAGIPPTAGFLGKYVIFLSAIHSHRYLLAVVGVLNAVVAAYYYLRVVVTLWMREPETEEEPLPVPFSLAAVLVVAAAGVLYLGFAPGRLLDLLGGLTSGLI